MSIQWNLQIVHVWGSAHYREVTLTLAKFRAVTRYRFAHSFYFYIAIDIKVHYRLINMKPIYNGYSREFF